MVQQLSQSSMHARTLTANGEQWWHANDVAKCLGYCKPNKAITDIIPQRLLKPKSELVVDVLNRNESKAYWTNDLGLRIFLSKARKPKATLFAREMKIDTVLRNIRQEEDALTSIERAFPGEVTRQQFDVQGYRLDMYFPEHRIVVECDEHNHAAYNPAAEYKRTSVINEVLDNPRVVRFNPDAPDFNIIDVIGQIYQLVRASLVKK